MKRVDGKIKHCRQQNLSSEIAIKTSRQNLREIFEESEFLLVSGIFHSLASTDMVAVQQLILSNFCSSMRNLNM